MQDANNPRRQFLKVVSTAAAVAPVLALTVREARADAALPHQTEADPTAAALGYREDGSKVDAAKFPQHKPDQNCANCNLAQGKAGDVWLACSLFAGKAVNSKGWCAAWVKKA